MMPELWVIGYERGQVSMNLLKMEVCRKLVPEWKIISNPTTSLKILLELKKNGLLDSLMLVKLDKEFSGDSVP